MVHGECASRRVRRGGGFPSLASHICYVGGPSDSNQQSSARIMPGPLQQAVLAAVLRLCALLCLSPCVVGGMLCAGTACLRLPKCPHTPDNSTLWQLVSHAPGLRESHSHSARLVVIL